MKIYKKISTGLIFALTLSIAILALGHKALAAANYGPDFWNGANYSLTDSNTIQVSNGGQRVTFSNPSGNTYPTGTFHVAGWPSTPPGICTGSNVITAKSSDLDKAKFTGSINVSYSSSSADSRGQTQTQCLIFTSNSISITNPKAGGTCNFIVCSQDDIKNLASAKFAFSSNSTIAVNFKNKKINFTDGDTSDSDHTFQAPAGMFCSGSGRDNFGAISIDDSDYQKISKSKTDVSGSLDVDWYSTSNGKCSDFGTDSNKNTSSIKVDASVLANLAGTQCNTPGAQQNGLTCTCPSSQGCVWQAAKDDSSSANDGNACEADNNTGFEWLLCGVLRGLDGFMDKMNGLIESQLVINVKANFNPNVHQAWAVFRTISSALLVVIMLVMVISQAFGGGPFDAYTIRKLLPRIVAAVIFIQLSWVIGVWLVGIANDLGRGIGQLMSVPFGGRDQLGLDKLIGQLGAAAPAGLEVTTLLAVGLAVWINPFGALMLALFIVLGAVVATATLLVREALVIGSVIFFPLAIVAWILPGTQKYWKMLWDNFIKALLLFPLIVALIYIGRIFAWIVGVHGGGSGPLDAFAIAIGFFGPYFLLPKAFKWGGNIMSMAASNIEKGVDKMGGEKGREFIKNRSEGWKRERQRNAANRIARIEKGEASRGDRLKSMVRGDYLKSGQWDPTLGLPGSRRRREQLAGYVARGEKAGQEEGEAVSALLDNELRGKTAGEAGDLLLRKIKEAKTGAEVATYLDRLARYKLVDHLKRARTMIQGGDAGGVAIRDAQGNVTGQEQLSGWTDDKREKMGAWNTHANGSLYDTFKGLDVQLLQRQDNTEGFLTEVSPGVWGVDISDEVLAGQTLQGWQDFMAEAQAKGQQVLGRETAERILHSQAGDRLDNKVRAYLDSLGLAGPTPGAAPAGAGGAGGGGGGPAAGGGTRPAVGEGGFIPNGELNVSHATPEGRVISADASDIDNFVHSVGGWDRLSDGDLMNIYHFRTGQHKAEAARQLRSRNLL